MHGHTQRKRYVPRASSGDVPQYTAHCARRESSTSSRYAIPCSLSTRTRELGLGRPACDTTTSTSTRALSMFAETFQTHLDLQGILQTLMTLPTPCTFRKGLPTTLSMMSTVL